MSDPYGSGTCHGCGAKLRRCDCEESASPGGYEFTARIRKEMSPYGGIVRYLHIRSNKCKEIYMGIDCAMPDDVLEALVDKLNS